ncbi:MAG: hypothetical protein IJ147_07650 [Lachnospiraceae bacterium]|nr:hypothetical protein [Lachnospiraceae bacterium]
MDAKPKYRTKQRELLLEYLRRMPGVHITAKDACSYLEEQGTPVGSTIVAADVAAFAVCYAMGRLRGH